MKTRPVRNSTIQDALVRTMLDTYGFRTELIIGLYDRELGDFVVPSRLAGTLDGYCEFCRIVRRSEPGDNLCQQDIRRRGCDARESCLESCHAGLWTYSIPIKLGDDRMGTLISGKFRLRDTEAADESRKRRKAVADKLGMSDGDRTTLEEAYLQVRELSRNELESGIVPTLRSLAEQIREVYELIYAQRKVRAEKEALQADILNISHELQIRLQAIMAVNENYLVGLHKELTHASSGALRHDTTLSGMKETLRELQKFRVIVLNFGEETTLGQYDFGMHNIGTIIRNSIELYESQAHRKGVYFEVRPDLRRFPMIEVSYDHITHAIHNLVDNAVKYSYYGNEDNPRTVRITGKRAGPYYSIAFENYGIGILPSEINRIFDRSYRGKLAEHERRTGSGLGLSLVKQIVEEHHGRIHVQSRTLDAAWLTCFTIYLPFEQR